MRVPPMSVSPLFTLAAAALVPALAAAQPAGPPHVKAGWWEMAMSMTGPMAMSQTIRTCTDESSDRSSAFTGGMKRPGACTMGPYVPTPGGWSFSQTCTAGKMTIATSGTARGDFNAGYHLESVTKMDPAPMPQMAETRMTIDAKWLGPCPAGKKPGDVERGR